MPTPGWIDRVYGERAIIEQIELLRHPKGEQQFLSTDRLRKVTRLAARLRVAFDHLMDAIYDLEQETGRQ